MTNSPRSLSHYKIRRGEISAYGRAWSSLTRLRWSMLIVGAVVIALLVLMLVLSWAILSPLVILIVCAVIVLVSVGLWTMYLFTRRHFVEPDLALSLWLQQICDGDLEAWLDLDNDHPHFKELQFHTRNLSTSLKRLSDDMDEMVESQTNKLSEQKRVSELLFKLTADISNEPENEQSFSTVCHYVADWFGSARVSCYRVAKGRDELNRVAIRSSNFGDSADADDSIGEITIDRIPDKISTITQPAESAGHQIWIPFYCGDQVDGVLVIERMEPQQREHKETQRVLSTVSEQLSLLCGQQVVQEQVLQARLSHDRNELASEIHDSLAQTLLAVRYQTTILSENLKSLNNDEINQDVRKIIGSIEEANEEVRGLIREHRIPLSEHRYADSLQVVIDQFSQDSGIAVFFQSDDPRISFTPREESVLQRIIGEALNNTRKYANASMIRVFLHQESTGVRRILVEDDGIGFEPNLMCNATVRKSKDNATQIGLTIMQERAISIGAKLTIDSEPTEGTRITITMPPSIEPQRESA